MSTSEMIDYWMKSAIEDIETAEAMFAAKRYLPCLFYCHLFVEKIIKALVIKASGEPAPYGHKLVRLANLTRLPFSEQQLDLLDELTRFNIKARYEDYKFSLYKQATDEFTKKYLARAKEMYIWIKQKI